MDKLIEYYKNPPSLNMSQFFGKPSSGTPAPIKVVATPKAAPAAPKVAAAPAPAPKAEAAKPSKASKGGGNFDLLKELKKLQ